MRIIGPRVSYGVSVHHRMLASRADAPTWTLKSPPDNSVVAGSAAEDRGAERTGVFEVHVVITVALGALRYVHVLNTSAFVGAVIPELPKWRSAMRATGMSRNVLWATKADDAATRLPGALKLQWPNLPAHELRSKDLKITRVNVTRT